MMYTSLNAAWEISMKHWETSMKHWETLTKSLTPSIVQNSEVLGREEILSKLDDEFVSRSTPPPNRSMSPLVESFVERGWRYSIFPLIQAFNVHRVSLVFLIVPSRNEKKRNRHRTLRNVAISIGLANVRAMVQASPGQIEGMRPFYFGRKNSSHFAAFTWQPSRSTLEASRALRWLR